MFYAHTISPVCIAVLWVIGMTGFTASYTSCPRWRCWLVICWWAWPCRCGAQSADKAVARDTGRPWPTPTAMCWKACAACGIPCSIRTPPPVRRASRPTARRWAKKQKALKYREGLTVAANTLILFTALAVLGVSLRLYQSGELGAEGVLICTLSALSSFGPVVALANLGASLTQVFASADRVLDCWTKNRDRRCDRRCGHRLCGAQAEHVSFAYAEEEVLHDLSLTIPEKKIVGITGAPAAAKATFLRLFMRFWDVSTGTIRFGERTSAG